MRVALLTNNLLPPREGIGRHLVELARRLPAFGIEALLVGRAPAGSADGLVEIEGVPARRIDWKGPPPFGHVAAQRALHDWLEAGADGAELLHVHLPLLLPLRTKLPVVVTVHSPMLADSAAITERGLGPLARKAYARLFSRHCEQAWLDRADSLVAVSAGVRDELVALYALRGREPLVASNGVDARFFAAAPAVRRAAIVLYVGRLAVRKGLDRLLDAFAGLPERLSARLVLLGEGPLERELRKRAELLGIAERVLFAGFVDRVTLRAWLARAAVVVNPADYESGPLTLLEAMAAGTPAVTTRTGLVPELGADPPLSVVERSVDSLRAGIEAVLADPQAAFERARRAQLLVRARFDWQRVARELASVYGNVAAQPRARAA
ncbi:MAG: glycosyltransferase family 4 protein [Geminicoccaceae bacterium]|nr:glycosyltransferase family 4 protein [Geminicoccaceae bacterium]